MFIDDRSRFTSVYFLKRKSELFEKFKHFVAWAENLTGKRVKILRSDNGGKYNQENLTIFARSEELNMSLPLHEHLKRMGNQNA